MKRIIAIAACLLMTVSLAACSPTESSSASSTASESSASSASSESSASVSSASSESSVSSESSASSEAGGGTDLATFLEENKAEIESAIAGNANENLDISVTAEGNVLKYVFKFNLDVGDTTAVAEQLSAALDQSEAQVTPLLNSIKLVVPSAEAIRFVYEDVDGNEIVSKDFK